MTTTTWYRTGTVSLTQGSAVVIGTGTAWVRSVIPGSIFVSADGEVYEAAEIISNTELHLASAYQGPTVAEALYAIAPTQGHLPDLAARVQELLSTFGELRETWEDVTPGAVAAKEAAEAAAGVATAKAGEANNSAEAAWASRGAAQTYSDTALGYRNEANNHATYAGGRAFDAAQSVGIATTKAGEAAASAAAAAAVIAPGTTAQYWRGDKTWRDFAGDVKVQFVTGTNGNGAYFTAPGFQLCRSTLSVAAGSSLVWTFPLSFPVAPQVWTFISGPPSAAEKALWESSSSGGAAVIYNPNAVAINVHLLAIL